MIRSLTLAAAASALLATSAYAEPVKYTLDPSHSQVVFTYSHLGFSNTTGMFSGFEGEIMFDEEDPEASSVNVEIPASSIITGWDKRNEHFSSDDFLSAEANPVVTFASTDIKKTGDDTAEITGDLTMNGVTKPVTLDAKLNKSGDHPMANKPWAGFDATATIKRSEWDMGKFAPNVSDEVELNISVEAQKADS
ncbi:YceI family protein [Notoacmeibacter sp. MSK16QG-6]|uniref:YceI family protein n=1 Tax=Notoacmeibacter sp. MSK16QG-6 TaxID=2957982 RepID=UPI0020A0BA6B|nr:YceI family protein [Notoacmeibacter sp. MSK16QG-6]MCP1198164.1 YceI family protein [Notoacmeibacter sp. MSK16QG-6]